jgi:hypothetical protein
MRLDKKSRDINKLRQRVALAMRCERRYGPAAIGELIAMRDAIQAALKEAQKSQDKTRVSTLRLISRR